MKKIFLFMMVSVDGFFEGPAHELNWHNVDAEFNEYAISQLNEADTLIFGRNTYEMMARYWPSAPAIRNDPVVAGKMNTLPKIVFSKTLQQVRWNNSKLFKKDTVEILTELKKRSGKDMAIFGSSNLATSLLSSGVIDEIRIMVNPVILGSGNRIFNGLGKMLKLTLLKTKKFHDGNVLLYYRPQVT